MPMKRSVACMSLLCSMLAVDAQWVAPAFYKGLEGPKYSVLKKGDGWELRRYEPASWVSIKREGMEVDQTMGGGPTSGFMRLFGYISGSNAAKTKIEMTAPVLTKMEPGQGPTCNSTFTMSFYNPYKYQGGTDAPKPTDSSVFINNMPALDVYVSSFGGFANSATHKQKAMELMNKLTQAKEPFSSKYWYTAGYDSPYTLTNRHNEVWVPAANQQQTAGAASEEKTAAAKGAVAGHKL